MTDGRVCMVSLTLLKTWVHVPKEILLIELTSMEIIAQRTVGGLLQEHRLVTNGIIEKYLALLHNSTVARGKQGTEQMGKVFVSVSKRTKKQ